MKLVFTLKKIIKPCKKILKGESHNKSVSEIKSENWNKLFVKSEFFEFSLTDQVKILLYKDSILSQAIYEGFEKEEIAFISSVLKKGDIFLDIGANTGLYSLSYSDLVGPEGRIIAFEPSPQTFERLLKNISINGFKNISALNVGLSERSGKLPFYRSLTGYEAWDSFARSKYNKAENCVEIAASYLDFELQNIDKSLIKAVKIDVEGWEKFVLLGGKDFFLNFEPIVMVEFTDENTKNAGYHVHEVFDLLQDWGYKWYRIVSGVLVPEVKQEYYPYNNLIALKNLKGLKSGIIKNRKEDI